MKDHDNIHLKVQDLCACFSNTDPLKEMAALSGEAETDDAALKWLALAVLHGINANAEKITLKEDGQGNISVRAQYRENDLPSPGSTIGSEIFDAVRQITHIEKDKGKSQLAIGVMDSSLDLSLGIKEKKGKRKISIKFPG